MFGNDSDAESDDLTLTTIGGQPVDGDVLLCP